MNTLAAALNAAKARLQAALALPREAAALEAHVLLGHVLGQGRAYLLARGEEVLAPKAAAWFEALLARRAAGEPVAYLTGKREFFGLELAVSPAVLIPRPETELLVELALEHIPPDASSHVLDLGTGSGAVALAIVRHRPRARVCAVDISPAALEVARRNATRLGIGAIEFVQSDWFEGLDAAIRYDVIVSNPPYVASTDAHLAQGDVRFEPRSALDGGPDGLQHIARIIAEAPGWLANSGYLLIEHGFADAEKCRALLEAAGFSAVRSARDLAGHERVSLGCLRG